MLDSHNGIFSHERDPDSPDTPDICAMSDTLTAQDVTCAPTPDKHPPDQGMEDPFGNVNPAAQLSKEAQDAFSDNLVRFERDRSSSSGTITATIGPSTPASNRSGTLECVPHSRGLSKQWELPPRPARGRKPKAGVSRAMQKKIAQSLPKTRPRRRGPLAPETKMSVARKRKERLVCVICHHKKDSCKSIDPYAPDGPCLRCKSRTLPCVRYRITDTTLYREQSAPYGLFSQRWKTMDLVDITNWATEEIRTIEMSLKLVHAPYQVRVRRFHPLPGDMIDEQWTKDGEIVTYPLQPYGIASMEEAALSISNMLDREVSNYLIHTIGDLGADSLVWETYLAAFRRASSAPTLKEQRLLFDTLRLWVMCRVTSNFEHIVGDDKLGVSPVNDQDSPYYGSVPPCGVMSAQLECIYYTKFLRPLSKTVLLSLMTLIDGKKPGDWYTIHLVLFMMLHSCSMTSRRDMEYAATLNLPVKFCNYDSIRQHNAGSTTLLAHYHQALPGSLPFKLALEGRHADLASMGVSTQEDKDFITRSAQRAAESKPSWDGIRNDGLWENDYFWISQLYDQDWKPEKMD